MSNDPNVLGTYLAAACMFYVVLYIVLSALHIVPLWFISIKAGFSPWLSLLGLFPLTGLILLYVLAFAEWKVVPAPQPVWQQPQPPYPPQA